MPRSAICLVIDRLQAGMLGAYGNTWLPTPNFDELAARSVVFDRCFADAPELAAAYQAYWYGRDAFAPASESSGASLAAQCNTAGMQTILVTDDAEVSAAPGAADFAERILIEHEPVTSLAAEVEQAQLYRLMAAAMDAASGAAEPFLLWVHARAMTGPWDAPAVFRQQFVEEDDPTPGDFFQPPSLQLAENHDPDEILPIRFAYAGQVTLVDHCIGALLEAIDDRTTRKPGRRSAKSESLLWLLTSPRGYPLGEHGAVGSADERIYNELVHVPLLVGSSDGAGAMSRSNSLAIPTDLFATLVDGWLSQGVGSPWTASLLSSFRPTGGNMTRDRVAFRTAKGRAIRTAGWSYRVGDDDRAELFAKPDDRWEVNEVSHRCADVATAMRESLDNYVKVRAEGAPGDLAPLPPELADDVH